MNTCNVDTEFCLRRTSYSDYISAFFYSAQYVRSYGSEQSSVFGFI